MYQTASGHHASMLMHKSQCNADVNEVQCCSVGSGGVFWIEDTAATTVVTNISSSTFADNVADTAKGGVFMLVKGLHTIADSMFLRNSAVT